MNKTKIFISIVLLIILIVLGFIFYKYYNNYMLKKLKKSNPIITIFTSESTTGYKIEFYQSGAIYSSGIGGIAGMIPNGEKFMKYSMNFDSKNIIDKIEAYVEYIPNSKISISINNGKQIYVDESNDILKDLYKLVNISSINN